MTEPVLWQDAWWFRQSDGSWLRFNCTPSGGSPPRPGADLERVTIDLKAVGAALVIGLILALALLPALFEAITT